MPCCHKHLNESEAIASPCCFLALSCTSNYSEKYQSDLIISTGTLGDCAPALGLWCRGMTRNVHSKCLATNIPSSQAEQIISKFHQSIGWDSVVNDLMPSAPLSAGTWDEIVNITAASLFDAGLNVAVEEVRDWHRRLGDIHAEDPPLIKNLPGFLKHFKHHGILVSICTSDDRVATNACMRNWNIADLVDYSICGDEVLESKPSAQPLMELCRRAGVMPHECLVVGDTSSDTGMGKNSGAGLVVGVLTGSGTEKQLLETGAHVVLPNIGYLEELLQRKQPFNPIMDQDDLIIAIEDSENLTPMKVKAA